MPRAAQALLRTSRVVHFERGALPGYACRRVPLAHFAVGMENSGPLGVPCGQRCMMDFCRV